MKDCVPGLKAAILEKSMNEPIEPLSSAMQAAPEDASPAPGGVRQMLKAVAIVLSVLAALGALGFVYVLWQLSHLRF